MAATTEDVVKSSIGSASFNTVYSKGTKGWKTGDEHKNDELKNIFDEMDHDEDEKVTLHNLVLHMKKTESGLVAKFGKLKASTLLKAFEKMDLSGSGVLSKEEFVKHSEAAFHHAASPTLKTPAAEGKDLQTLPHSADIPVPPPMTRELIYKTIFSTVDKKRKGYITFKDLVYAMREQKNIIEKEFGVKGTKKAIAIFEKLDIDDTVSCNCFLACCC